MIKEDIMTKLMAGKKGLIMGAANERSIAWGIAQACHEQGAELGFTYQGEALKKRITPLAESLDASLILECDVTDDAALQKTFKEIEAKWGKFDFIVHSIAFSDKNELTGKYLATSRENFLRTMDISCYSLTKICQLAEPLLNPGASILTMTYYGAEQVLPHYNVMGVAKAALEASVRYLAHDFGPQNIRVNAISAGPIKTLAASGIGDFKYILKWNEYNSPLRKNVTTAEIGNSGLYLLSDLSSGVTGETHHVDAGYHTVGMMAIDKAAEISELLDTVKHKY